VEEKLHERIVSPHTIEPSSIVNDTEDNSMVLAYRVNTELATTASKSVAQALLSTVSTTGEMTQATLAERFKCSMRQVKKAKRQAKIKAPGVAPVTVRRRTLNRVSSDRLKSVVNFLLYGEGCTYAPACQKYYSKKVGVKYILRESCQQSVQACRAYMIAEGVRPLGHTLLHKLFKHPAFTTQAPEECTCSMCLDYGHFVVVDELPEILNCMEEAWKTAFPNEAGDVTLVFKHLRVRVTNLGAYMMGPDMERHFQLQADQVCRCLTTALKSSHDPACMLHCTHASVGNPTVLGCEGSRQDENNFCQYCAKIISLRQRHFSCATPNCSNKSHCICVRQHNLMQIESEMWVCSACAMNLQSLTHSPACANCLEQYQLITDITQNLNALMELDASKNLRQSLKFLQYRMSVVCKKLDNLRGHKARVVAHKSNFRRVLGLISTDCSKCLVHSDYSSKISLKPHRTRTAEQGIKVVAHISVLTYKYPSLDIRQSYTDTDFDAVYGPFDPVKEGDLFEENIQTLCDDASLDWTHATATLECDIRWIRTHRPWLKNLYRATDNVDYYKSTLPLCALVDMNEHLKTTATDDTSIRILENFGEEPGHGKCRSDTITAFIKGTVKRARNDGKSFVNAADVVNELQQKSPVGYHVQEMLLPRHKKSVRATSAIKGISDIIGYKFLPSAVVLQEVPPLGKGVILPHTVSVIICCLIILFNTNTAV